MLRAGKQDLVTYNFVPWLLWWSYFFSNFPYFPIALIFSNISFKLNIIGHIQILSSSFIIFWKSGKKHICKYMHKNWTFGSIHYALFINMFIDLSTLLRQFKIHHLAGKKCTKYLCILCLTPHNTSIRIFSTA